MFGHFGTGGTGFFWNIWNLVQLMKKSKSFRRFVIKPPTPCRGFLDIKFIFVTYVFFRVPVRLENFENDELGEALEAGYQSFLLQHFGEDPKHQGPRRAGLVVQILKQKTE